MVFPTLVFWEEYDELTGDYWERHLEDRQLFAHELVRIKSTSGTEETIINLSNKMKP
jgi:hypothetical protein